MKKDEDEKEELKAEEKSAETEEETEEELGELLKDEEEKEEEKPEEEKAETAKAEEAEEEAEEAEVPSKREKEEEEEIVEERTYTVPLSKAWIMPPSKRAPRAMRILKSFIIKHMKLEKRAEAEEGEEEEPKRLVVSNEVNERIWSRSIEKPPRKLRVRAAKDKEGNVTVYLAEGE